MKIINEAQGSEMWLVARAHRFCASEAPAMMGSSKHQTRSDLLKQKATGLTPEVDAATQRRFDAGHAAEEAARPIVENIIGDDLSAMTGAIEIDGLPLLASFDGVTQGRDIIWESKLWNAALADQVRAGQLEPHYYWQIEQQLLVSGAERAYFTTSDGTPENTLGMWYESQPERRAKLIAGWHQFAIDLENYQHVEATVAPVAATIEALPALMIQVEGKVLATNLDQFKASAQTFIANINTDLQTDQDFADADKMVKFLKDGEERLALCKSQALAQTASIDELFRTIDAISGQMKDKRLMLDKLVAAEKQKRRSEIVWEAQKTLNIHVMALESRAGVSNVIKVDGRIFEAAVKNLKSLDSMRDKVSAALANAKIEANEIADRIDLNAKAAKDVMHLFPDFSSVCTKATDDFAALLALRTQQEAARADAQAKAQAATDQCGKADAGVGLSPDGRAQPEAASTAPQSGDHIVVIPIIDDFLGLLDATPSEKKILRMHLVKFVRYQAAREMQAVV